MGKNRDLHELLGLCWHEEVSVPLDGFHHCSCEKRKGTQQAMKYHITQSRNPDYAADPLLVLREMEKREELERFTLWLRGKHDTLRFRYCGEKKPDFTDTILRLVALDTTGKLRDLAIEYLRKE